MQDRDKLAAKYAKAKATHRGQARAFADLQAATHAALQLKSFSGLAETESEKKRSRFRMARLWALLVGR